MSLKIEIPNNNLQERKYIINILLSEFLGLDFSIITSETANNYTISFDDKKLIIEDYFFSKHKKSLSYLHKDNIPNKVELFDSSYSPEDNIPCIYGKPEIKKSENEITCGLDIFASSFFMLTRWEENVITTKDKHNRFPDELSLAQKHNFHKRPIVNEYTELLWQMLIKLGFSENIKKQEYKFTPTHDIDFLFKYSSFKKYLKAIGGDLIKRKNPLLCFKTTADYLSIKFGSKKDTFDTFDFIIDASEKANVKSTFLFIPSEIGKADAQYNIADKKTKYIIDNVLKRGHKIGVHSSWDSFNNKEIFDNELSELNNLSSDILLNRQHFLRFENPKTWQIIDSAGIKIDSTLGYSNTNGFRAGTCYSYPIFDIINQKQLNLIEKPLIFMESVYSNEHIDKSMLINDLYNLADTVKKYNGEFVFLWHNSNLLSKEWKDIYDMYPEIIRVLASKNS